MEKERRPLDGAAFAELFQQHGEQAFRYARMMGLSAADAEDVVGESLMRTWSARASFRGEATPATWFFRIVKNHALNWIRGEKRLQRRHQASKEVIPMQVSHSPGRRIENAEMHAAMVEAIDALPEQLRSALSLVSAGKLSYRGVAELEGVSLGTISSRVFEARKAIRRTLAARGLMEV